MNSMPHSILVDIRSIKVTIELLNQRMADLKEMGRDELSVVKQYLTLRQKIAVTHARRRRREELEALERQYQELVVDTNPVLL